MGELRSKASSELNANMECSACCGLCSSKLHPKHVLSAEWPREHANRCGFLVKMGVSLDSTACICMACNTAILRGTRLLMDDKLPQEYKPRWHKKHASLVCCIPGCTVKGRVMNHPYSWDMICEHFDSALQQQQHGDMLPLCMAHYLQLGCHNKPKSGSDVVCKVCGIKRP